MPPRIPWWLGARVFLCGFGVSAVTMVGVAWLDRINSGLGWPGLLWTAFYFAAFSSGLLVSKWLWTRAAQGMGTADLWLGEEGIDSRLDYGWLLRRRRQWPWKAVRAVLFLQARHPFFEILPDRLSPEELKERSGDRVFCVVDLSGRVHPVWRGPRKSFETPDGSEGAAGERPVPVWEGPDVWCDSAGRLRPAKDQIPYPEDVSLHQKQDRLEITLPAASWWPRRGSIRENLSFQLAVGLGCVLLIQWGAVLLFLEARPEYHCLAWGMMAGSVGFLGLILCSIVRQQNPPVVVLTGEELVMAWNGLWRRREKRFPRSRIYLVAMDRPFGASNAETSAWRLLIISQGRKARFFHGMPVPLLRWLAEVLRQELGIGEEGGVKRKEEQGERGSGV